MSAPALARTEIDDDTIELPQVLAAVQEFGAASMGLVAWEYCRPERCVAPAWAAAIRQGLISPVGVCEETGEAMFALKD